MAPKRMRTVEGSCWPCKDRRVICDLQRPRCSRCAASSQPCGYGKVRLRWCNGVAARGRFAGQNIPISAHGDEGGGPEALGQPGNFKEAGGRAPEAPATPERSSDRAHKDSRSLILLRSNLVSPTSLGLVSAITVDQLILYFEHEVIYRFNLSPDQLKIDLLSISKDPALRHSATAVANAHHFLYVRKSPKAGALVKRKARLDAIRLFRKQLQTPASEGLTSEKSSAAVLHLFVTNVLLCILDGVIDPADEGAAAFCHFQGGLAILSRWNIFNQLFQAKKGLLALMLSIFTTLDLNYALLSGRDPYFHHSLWPAFAESDSWWGKLDPGNPFLEIMAILSQLAHMGWLVRGNKMPSGSKLSSLLAVLQQSDFVMQKQVEWLTSSPTLTQHLPSPPWSPSVTVTSDSLETLDLEQSWAIFCGAYRLTGLIYMYRVLYGLKVTHPLVQQATAEGVQAICGVRLIGKLSHCLIFPTLVIGSHCRTLTQQTAIRAATESTATFLYFGSMRMMQNFLEGLWRRADVNWDWWETFDDISKRTFLF
jgi:hypothetical protein